MSADLSTNIKLEGTIEELKAMIGVIKNYSTLSEDNYLEFVRIDGFDGKDLDNYSEDELNEYIENCSGKISVDAEGPYGLGGVDETRLFELIAEAAPNAKFYGSISGFTTGQQDFFAGTLEDAKLSLKYEVFVDGAYNEYLYEENVGESFVDIFKITEEDFEDCFYDYAEDIISDEFYGCSYIDFKERFQTALKEEEFQDAMERFKNLGLKSEDDLWYMEKRAYDPIRKEYMFT